MRNVYLAASVAVFGGLLVLGWVTHGTGVIRNDPERSISIPDELTTKLQVMASYNSENIYFRYRWPVDRPSMSHDVLVYQDGEWIRQKGGEGYSADFLNEDRVSMMIDDGSVPLFSRYGGYITIGDSLTTFTGAPDTGDERTKYLPESRSNPGDFDTTRPGSDLSALRAAGYFIDLWQWRSGRSNPIAVADDGNILEDRSGDEGRGPYSTNWDKALKQPKFMFNPEVAGFSARSFEDYTQGTFGFDDIYYLSDETAIAFDPALNWQNGDTIPRRKLRSVEGSRGDVTLRAPARWEDGYWDVTLVRQMDTGNPADDKIFMDQGSYDLAFAIFRNASAGRWHYVSLPVSLGIGTEADLVAERFTGRTPKWEQEWTDLEMFYPGQVSWPMLTDPARHPGAEEIEDRVPVAVRHNPEQLALYGVEVEFASEIKRQWWLTLLASLSLIIGLGISINFLMTRKEA